MFFSTIIIISLRFISYRKIAVVGAGLMGAGIVQVSIDKGYDVIMKDTNQSGLYRGISQIQKGLDGAVKRKRISRFGVFLIKKKQSYT